MDMSIAMGSEEFRAQLSLSAYVCDFRGRGSPRRR